MNPNPNKYFRALSMNHINIRHGFGQRQEPGGLTWRA